MALSAKARKRLEVALAHRAEAQEIADAIDAASAADVAADIADLQSRVSDLEAANADLEARVAALENA